MFKLEDKQADGLNIDYFKHGFFKNPVMRRVRSMSRGMRIKNLKDAFDKKNNVKKQNSKIFPNTPIVKKRSEFTGVEVAGRQSTLRFNTEYAAYDNSQKRAIIK